MAVSGARGRANCRSTGSAEPGSDCVLDGEQVCSSPEPHPVMRGYAAARWNSDPVTSTKSDRGGPVDLEITLVVQYGFPPGPVVYVPLNGFCDAVVE